MPNTISHSIFGAATRRTGDPSGQHLAWRPETDLGERVWLDWDADLLDAGPVAGWSDRMEGKQAVQNDPERRPIATGAGVTFAADQCLDLPVLQEPSVTHRAVVILFKADLSSAEKADGLLVAVNGIDGSAASRVPALQYLKSIEAIRVQWGGQSDAKCTLEYPASANEGWHVVVSRRVDGRAYASLDGGVEVDAGVDGLVLPRDRIKSDGRIGDSRGAGIAWTLRRFMLIQGETSAAEVDRLAGWALHSVGAQDRLPLDHPYRDRAPESDPWINPFVGNTDADWTGGGPIKAGWSNGPSRGRAIAPVLEGFETVWEDDFTAMSVTDEEDGLGPWYAPVHNDAAGAATGARPSDAPVFAQSGSELRLTMQRHEDRWWGGVMTTINYDGRGRTWNPGERPTYFEARIRATRGNGFASWPAFWLKDQNEYFMKTVPRTEIDVYEGYNSDPDGHHASYHNHAPDRIAAPDGTPWHRGFHRSRFTSHYTGMALGNGKEWGTVDLFDDGWRTYGCLIDRDRIVVTFEGREILSMPTRPDMLRPLYILIDLALLPHQADQAEGTYEMGIDWVRVRQGRYAAPAKPRGPDPIDALRALAPVAILDPTMADGMFQGRDGGRSATVGSPVGTALNAMGALAPEIPLCDPGEAEREDWTTNGAAVSWDSAVLELNTGRGGRGAVRTCSVVPGRLYRWSGRIDAGTRVSVRAYRGLGFANPYDLLSEEGPDTVADWVATTRAAGDAVSLYLRHDEAGRSRWGGIVLQEIPQEPFRSPSSVERPVLGMHAGRPILEFGPQAALSLTRGTGSADAVLLLAADGDLRRLPVAGDTVALPGGAGGIASLHGAVLLEGGDPAQQTAAEVFLRDRLGAGTRTQP